ncbi:site-specific integrase [Actinomycetospora sp. NBRC 106375]|uniref:tyrosine-type recombinase/integrase n=1 Tax=Actinomycetospora sp. NBRC 106375 TaxID=3032207 RepID=UPI0024A1AE8B|nr:tyrosine-type recombinase/integrase [Actinomycetospora sp. NBRC 106375]GLZ48071.1 site-specific integrase [Actinomycetospora sp. NBRC 106375]
MPPRKRRQRGHIGQLPSGAYRVRVYAGTDALTGRPRQLCETVPTYAEATKALTRLQGQVDEDTHPKSDITVGQAVERWLEVVVLEDTTRERYDDLIRLYVLPTFGAMPAGRVDAELLERFYARLHRCRVLSCNGKARGGHVCRPLSTSTTRKVHYIIRGALDRAVRWRHLGVNKAAMAEAPAPRRTEPDPPSADEAARLLNAAWSDPEWGLLLWLTMLTGPRRGEVSALRWRHIDFARGLLWVHQANAQTKAGLKEKSTKTNQRRKVALDEHTVDLLKAHRERWRERCEQLGVPLSPDAFVFSPAPDGATPYLPRAISQRYRRLALRLKLRSTRLHSLRHYSATELVAAGVDIRTVAGRLGHGSGGATTLKVYAAWVDEADRRAATTMATVLPRPVPEASVRRSPYEGIAEALREQIRSGALQPGAELPTVAEIAVANTVAVGTAHRALAALKADGLVRVSRGRRAVVQGLSDTMANR